MSIKGKKSSRSRKHSVKTGYRTSGKPGNAVRKTAKPAFGLGIRQKGSPRPKRKAVIDLHDKKKAIKINVKAETDKKAAADAQKKEYIDSAKQIIGMMMADKQSADYLERMVSQRAKEVINMLNRPRSDEEIAKRLDVKINTVRRILNVLQGYGITNYSISKNKDGWLSFVWELDTKKASFFTNYVNNGPLKTEVVTEGCNDYFVCDRCYKENKLILTFDAAYESNFKCVCEKNLSQVTKDQVGIMIAKAKNDR